MLVSGRVNKHTCTSFYIKETNNKTTKNNKKHKGPPSRFKSTNETAEHELVLMKIPCLLG